MTDRPNILFIMTDQQSHHMMSCAGNPWLNTPAMDSLAATGVRFTHTFCTDPVCVPSRFSFATGRYPSAIGMRANTRPNGDRPLPDHILQNGLGHPLRAAGYQTVYGGKEHFTGASAEAYGFEYICRDERDELATTCADWLHQPHDQPFCLVASFINPHDICYLAINDFVTEGVDQSIKERGKVELHTALAAAQNPPGMDDDTFFPTVCPPLPDNHHPQDDEPDAIHQLLDQRNFRRQARDLWTERDWRRHRWAYHRLTELVDKQIGIVLEALDSAGLADNTIVIFTSDHGDHSASHKLEHKTIFYEEATRIPMIIRDPASTSPGTTSDALVCNGLDIFPTICDYAQAIVPDDLTGRSLRSLAQGVSPTDWRGHVYIESEFGYGIRTADHLYALYDQGANREQLYDLTDDPGQSQNAAQIPANQSILQHHRHLLSQTTHHSPKSIPGIDLA